MVEIIAEIANSHEGSVDNAKKLALKSLESGADAVKFQIYFAEELLVKNHPDITILKINLFIKKS